jgi:hypothetical protein
MRPTQGIVTGDRLGPTAFLLDNHKYLRELWMTQGFHEAEEGIAIYPKGSTDWSSAHGGLVPYGNPGTEQPLGSITYADDGAEVIVFEQHKLSVVSVAVELIEDLVEAAGGSLSHSKSELQIHMRGRNALKIHSRLEKEGLECREGTVVPVVSSSKHMGSLVNIDGAITPEVFNRLSKGKQAVGRVGTKFLFKLITPVGIRVEIFKTLVLTVLLYNLHVRVIAGWQMRLFERFQTRVLRGIDGKGRHITRETNECLRRRLGVPSIESLLRVRRILFWQTMLRGGDATRGVRMIAFSPTQFDESPLTRDNQVSMLRLLKSDLVLLREANVGLELAVND